ncbi:M56 family metallopeptidase [Pedobacter lithocola]|uniref:M56 family metallopeptidase n=1 Tax=Pedobacter lithocola TaxID=1908239 RepID=A0ABV8PBR3_9SPHI
MMTWLYYLLEANLYLVFFYGFYRLFLQKETFYTLNRSYLVLSTVMAFSIPLLQLGFLSKEVLPQETTIYNEVMVDRSIFSIANFLMLAYLFIAMIFFAKMLWGFRHIIRLIKKPSTKTEQGITIIPLENTSTAFSFFNLLFIDPGLPQTNTIIHHEMAHIRQRHSFDVVFFEIDKCVCWFNPIAHLLKSDIKLVHEYLADEETTNHGIEKYEYAVFLIQNSCGNRGTQLTNQIFNSSILKNRINMLNQKKSAKWARLKLLLALPIVGGMLCASTMAFTKDYGTIDLYPKKNTSKIVSIQDTAKRQKAVEVIIIQEPTVSSKRVKGVKLAPPPPPPAPPTTKKVKGVKLAPPPPATEIPLTKKVKGIHIAPPPPPVEPKGTKQVVDIKSNYTKEGKQVLDIQIAPPPPPVDPKSKKQPDKNDVIYGDPIKGTK